MVERESTPYLAPKSPVFIGFKNDILTVVATAPTPPGSRLEFRLNLQQENKTVNVFGKIVTVRQLREGEFEMGIRLHTLGREERTALTKEHSFLAKEKTARTKEQASFIEENNS
jgi:hypothetical protein